MAKPRKGRCYERSFQALLDTHSGWTLVHGRPTLTVDPFIEYGHAWLESPDGFWCYNAETRDVITASLFYDVGNIRREPDRLFKYTKTQAATMALKFQHYGPWEGPEACPPIKRRTKK
jgi:hypothetical protein